MLLNKVRILFCLRKKESKKIARNIVEDRKSKEITTEELVRIIESTKKKKNHKTHSATKVFQALRIFVNKEITELVNGIINATKILKPGGKMVILEFSKPKQFLFKGFYNIYMNLVAPGFGKMIAKNKEAYQYLNDSVQAFPEGDAFTNIMEKVGYTSITSKKLTFGICTIYCGKK